ncbi:hypothetical protein H257_08763 [Aphanomyces astaci]|uniref:Uncharacterized protein n=1 Tax=Aphanomyces astaci TaxID=112090 RepID=W4GCA2_APHAT|nr:hypothetical protein H257_08763 [Aphanomyces astaci]ETV77317.1 hypothetical protein H257_08763 [Aphanomyces astaci]|eukprot:XP_009833104.1 hypothetical protein H257_08763 [Aphanomyces astaci]
MCDVKRDVYFFNCDSCCCCADGHCPVSMNTYLSVWVNVGRTTSLNLPTLMRLSSSSELFFSASSNPSTAVLKFSFCKSNSSHVQSALRLRWCGSSDAVSACPSSSSRFSISGSSRVRSRIGMWDGSGSDIRGAHTQ